MPVYKERVLGTSQSTSHSAQLRNLCKAAKSAGAEHDIVVMIVVVIVGFYINACVCANEGEDVFDALGACAWFV